MSAMGQKVFEVQEDIAEMLSTGKSVSEIKEIVEEVHGSMFSNMVEEIIRGDYD